MDGIRKYSKEWFTLQGKKSDEYRNNIASSLEKGANSVNAARNSSIETSIFLGSKDEMLEKLQQHKSGIHGAPSSTMLATETYGAENIFDALDADGDGTVTEEEIKEVAALSTKEFADKDDTLLSTEDLALLYENAIDSVNASFIDMGAKKEFHYENGDVTKITLGSRGGISSKSVETVNDDGSKSGITYYYSDQSTSTTEKDSEGRILSTKYSSKDKTQNRETNTVYNEDGTRTVNTKDYVSNRTTVYDDNNKVLSKGVDYNYDINGEIENTKQASIGDCWVLSGVNSLRTSSVGAAFIEDAIKQNDDGSVTVTLKGVNKSYTYSAREIIDNEYSDPNKSFSKGDTDMNLLERAIGDYRRELLESGDYKRSSRDLDKTTGTDSTVENPLEGGQIDEAIYYITGYKSEFVSSNKNATEDMLDTYSKCDNKYIMNCSFKNKDESIQEGVITTSHAYSITKVDDDYVYVVNPWDSSVEIPYPREEFVQNAKQVSLTDLMPGQSETYITAMSDDVQFVEGDKSYQPKTKIGKFLKNLFD